MVISGVWLLAVVDGDFGDGSLRECIALLHELVS